MQIQSPSQFNLNLSNAYRRDKLEPQASLAKDNTSGVSVSLSQEGREKQQAESAVSDKKDVADLHLNGSVMKPEQSQEKPISLEDLLEKRIEEIKEEIEALESEIAAVRGDNSEKAQEKLEALQAQMMALLTELNSLMQQKFELTKKG